MEIVGYLLAALVGVSLGLIGSGGSILSVPILVYIMGINPVVATAYSLFIVGSTALVGGVLNALEKRVDFKTVLIFGIPSIIVVYTTRMWLVPIIPASLGSVAAFEITKPIALMLLFAVVMLMASFSMIKPSKNKAEIDENAPRVYNYPMILLVGCVVGTLTGLVGAGGLGLQPCCRILEPRAIPRLTSALITTRLDEPLAFTRVQTHQSAGASQHE